MEIIAQRRRGALAICLTPAILIWIFTAILIPVTLLGIAPEDSYIVDIILPIVILSVICLFVTAVSIYQLLLLRKSPDRITLDGSQVDLGNGYIVKVKQILNVEYRMAATRFGRSGWGTLTVYLENQKLNYYYISNVQQSRDRLMELVLKSRSEN